MAGGTPPSTNVSNITFSNVAGTTLTATFTRGNGAASVLFMKQSPTPTMGAPVDTTSYTASTHFGTGSQIGSTGYFCVYNSTGTSVNIDSLSKGTYYFISGHERSADNYYNNNTAPGNPSSTQLTDNIPSITNGSTSASFLRPSRMHVIWTVSSENGSTLDESGVVYSYTSSSPLVGTAGSYTQTSSDPKEGGQILDMSKLKPGKRIWYRGYAHNAEGYGYDATVRNRRMPVAESLRPFGLRMSKLRLADGRPGRSPLREGNTFLGYTP